MADSARCCETRCPAGPTALKRSAPYLAHDVRGSPLSVRENPAVPAERKASDLFVVQQAHHVVLAARKADDSISNTIDLNHASYGSLHILAVRIAIVGPALLPLEFAQQTFE